MVWNEAIACYLFLAGMGAGAFALAAITGFVRPEAKKVRTVGYLVAPVAVAIGCVLLMVDAKGGLMNPLRFFYIVSNLGSVMSWGVIILCAFIVVGAASLLLMWKKGATPKALDIVGLVLSVATAAYTGLLLGCAPGYPFWNPVVLPLLFIVSAAASGFAVVLLAAYATGSKEPREIGFLHQAGKVLPILEAVLIAVLFAVAGTVGGSGAAAASASVSNMLSGPYAVAFWGGVVIVGLVLPFALELVRAKKDAAGSTAVMAIVGEAAVLAGAFMLRYLVIMAAVPMFG